jgi:hypothetical protein
MNPQALHQFAPWTRRSDIGDTSSVAESFPSMQARWLANGSRSATDSRKQTATSTHGAARIHRPRKSVSRDGIARMMRSAGVQGCQSPMSGRRSRCLEFLRLSRTKGATRIGSIGRSLENMVGPRESLQISRRQSRGARVLIESGVSAQCFVAVHPRAGVRLAARVHRLREAQGDPGASSRLRPGDVARRLSQLAQSCLRAVPSEGRTSGRTAARHGSAARVELPIEAARNNVASVS